MDLLASIGLYWVRMLKFSHRTGGLRALALVVTVVQLTSVTWVPVVHPLIHPDRALSTPLSAVDVPTSGAEQLVLGETMCVACMVSPNALPSPYRFVIAPVTVRRQTPPRETGQHGAFQSFTPTNPARAPPSL